jgi:hypothetical protein
MGDVVSSIFGGGGGGGGSVPGAPPLSQYDPFSAVGGTGAAVGSESGRQYAANQLYGLIKDPSATLAQPGYQMTLAQGIAAQQAAGAASGTLQSGRQAAALQGYGQNIFNQYYNQLYTQLGQLSGATTQTPGSTTQAQYGQQLQQSSLQNQIQQQNAALGLGLTGLIGQGLYSSGIFGGSGGLFGGGGSSTGLGGYSADQLAQGAMNPVSADTAASYMAMMI